MKDSLRKASDRFPVAGIALSLVLLVLFGVTTTSASTLVLDKMLWTPAANSVTVSAPGGTVSGLSTCSTGTGTPTKGCLDFDIVFKATSAQSVNALGVWAASLPSGSETVELYSVKVTAASGKANAGGSTLLATATVSAGNTYGSSYDWALISPVTLVLNTYYAVEVYSSNGQGAFSSSAPSTAAGISLDPLAVANSHPYAFDDQGDTSRPQTLQDPQKNAAYLSGPTGSLDYVGVDVGVLPEGGSSALYLLLAAAACLGALLLNSRARIASPAIA